MSGQPSVLQVVVMRDGLLVGTEVFVPGQYAVGSGPEADLRLEDPAVSAVHAFLHFKQGRSAVQEAGSGMVFVNGHRVPACEVRSMDEIAIGPFSLKVRVVTQKAQPSAPSAPPPVAHAAPPRPQVPPVPNGWSGPEQNVTHPQAQPPQARAAPPPTVVSRRGSGQSLQPVPASTTPQVPARAPQKVSAADLFGEEDTRTESVAMAPPSTQSEPSFDTDPDGQPQPAPRAEPARARPQVKKAPARAHHRAVPSIPAADEGKGSPHLFLELYWGEVRRFAGAFGTLDKNGLVATEDDGARAPLWGFGLDGQPFKLADEKGGVYRVYVPEGASVERRATDGQFYPAEASTLEQGPGGRPCVTLGAGHALRLVGGEDMALVAYVQPAIPKPKDNLVKGLPWLVLALLALFASGFAAFIFVFGKMPEQADFQNKALNPVAVRLIAPPKKEEKKKIEEKIERLKHADKKPEVASKVEKALPKAVAPETRKALKSIEKLTAAGPALKDLLAAVDKMGNGPGRKDAKSDYKLNGLIGKAPIASAGIGTFGLGGGGAGGTGIKGLEMLRGKGGGGIGALGTGGVGRGSVAGTVTHASARAVAAQGSIDKDAVAKAINSHLGEVSGCYERALLKEPGLSGKIVLEWSISTSGTVTTARTKNSTMKSAAVEQCILNSLKGWKFPPAQGAGVIITYPFMFNSVGF